MKQKIQYLDDARTLAILWVVLIQHNFAPYDSYFGWVPNGSYGLFNSTFLHLAGYFSCISMPLCFFVAGIVAFLSSTRMEDNYSFISLMKKKAKRLLLPAILFGLVFQVLVEHSISYKAFIGYKHMWFIMDLFIISLVFTIVNERIKHVWHIVLALTAITITSFVSNRLLNFCSGYFFYLLGFMVADLNKKHSVKMPDLNSLQAISCFLLSVVAFLCLPDKMRRVIQPIVEIPVLILILKTTKFLHCDWWFKLCKYSYGIYIFHMLYLYIIYDGLNQGGQMRSC